MQRNLRNRVKSLYRMRERLKESLEAGLKNVKARSNPAKRERVVVPDSLDDFHQIQDEERGCRK